MISIACQRPTELGYAQELWTLPPSTNTFKSMQRRRDIQGFQQLQSHISRNFSRNKILSRLKSSITVKKRDPDFESKMHEVLLVYKQIEMQFDETGTLIVPDDYKLTITVSYDEKPGIQAISNTAPDLRPAPGHGEIYRDAEYKRLGTLSLLAGIDLLNRRSIPLVRDTTRVLILLSF